MNLKALGSVAFTEKGVLWLLELPAPEQASLRISQRRTAKTLDNLFFLWLDLLHKSTELPSLYGKYPRLEGPEIPGRLFLVISAYFDALIQPYLLDRRGVGPLPKALQLGFLARCFVPSPAPAGMLHLTPQQILSSYYLLAMQAFYFIFLCRGHPALRSPVDTLEKNAHGLLAELYDSVRRVQGRNEQIAAKRMMRAVLTFSRKVYSDATVSPGHAAGPFSSIRTHEISLLARRDPSVERRYGRKYVERVFENQLALIMQSFGLYVISTRVGQSTVDLVCISSDSEKRTTFLLEAKTTKAGYSLPRSDSRAIRDYVTDVRRSLTTLPPLSLVLLLGNAPAKGLSKKLAELEADVAVPVRFMPADQLAVLRERIVGPLPLGIFIREAVGQERIIGPTLVKSVAESYDAEQSAHQRFVEAMLSARGIIPTARDRIESSRRFRQSQPIHAERAVRNAQAAKLRKATDRVLMDGKFDRSRDDST